MDAPHVSEVLQSVRQEEKEREASPADTPLYAARVPGILSQAFLVFWPESHIHCQFKHNP